ncbi:hypothetical protein BDC45DRAFT_561703 [Circinella umbellata]|nr:hypothetical protein BDC45DRAFT_561703 [Circinella umbellata]
MNQPGDFTQILPLEVTTTIFLYITTFEDFLSCYWVSPAWRRLIINYFFPRLSSILADNPPFSTFPRLKFKIIMFAEKVNRSRNVRPTFIYAPYSFPFLYMMYYMNNIDLTLRIRRTIYTLHLQFSGFVQYRTHLRQQLLKTMRILTIIKRFFPSIMHNLHLSKKYKK